MGCVSSKQAVSVTPAFDHSGALRENAGAGSVGTNSGRSRVGFPELEKKRSSGGGGSKKKKKNSTSGGVSDLGSGCGGLGLSGSELGESGRASSRSDSLSLRLGNLQKYIEGEHVAAGWPAWLSAVAGEAIHGWVPLKADSFEKLEKIGQGTYSTVFRARDLETGKIVALKKVRFDNFEPESVRFMAREILILRRLDHPNIIKLEGIITSRMSCSIYLVFEYMEHDITGLLSCPDIKFSESQYVFVNHLCSVQVEQLHKIFKLCGSPPDDYWKKSRLPHATLFKPQQPYDSCLRETFKDLPATAVNLIETLLSVEPYKRGTASSALASEYFTTKPYACDPSSLPVYPPSKEIDAKHREEAKRKKISGRVRGSETRKPIRKPHGISKLAPVEDAAAAQTRGSQKINGNHVHNSKQRNATISDGVPNPSTDGLEEAAHVKHASQGDIPYSGPLQVSTSSGFAWAKRQKDDASIRSHSRSISRGHIYNSLEPSAQLNARNNFDSKRHENGDVIYGGRTDSRGHDSYEAAKRAMQKQWSQFERPDSFDASDGGYHSQELSLALYQREEMAAKRNNLDYQDEGDKVEFSGPLLSQSHRVDELLERHERQIRQAIRKSWFQRGITITT
ncbi:hypothetical protein QUC31_007496 [Theobroma cacao]